MTASLTTVKVSARRVSVKVKDAYWVMVAVDKDKPALPPEGRGERRCDPLEGPKPPRSGAATMAGQRSKERTARYAKQSLNEASVTT